ncbi:lysophospholipid acyltransferase family protein [Candidatus Chloroploca asiatica]|uniref:lysophospholipid acyltransferase family protein n=1 Tax=Candidatus Chloroploca asiatica TaxID=1506545 RepID=UPI001FEC7187|nr:lysophospholipid acyltransferase family protein [Candidatus Chloroploca asiatica]
MMSDDVRQNQRPEEQPGEIEEEISVMSAPPPPAPRKPAASGKRNTPPPKPPVLAEEEEEIVVTTPPPPVQRVRTPTPPPFWSDRQNDHAPDDDVPISGASASSLYENELELRNLAEQTNTNVDAMGKLAAGTLKLIADNMRQMTDQQIERVNEMLRGIDLKDYLDPAFWEGIGMILRYQVDEQVAFIKRRMSGQYETDAYGMDREIIDLVRPSLMFLYRTWWRVSVEGLEHVPAEGRALLVGNHSGVLPWDGAMIATAVAEEHPAQNQRIVRSMHLHWFSTLPFVAPALAALGQVPGLPENAIRLLEQDELVSVFPEGLKGVGKLFKDRYKLARFGRGGFVQAAIRAQAPIVPVAVVGAEEIYPMFANAENLAKLLGMPYFPLTPFFPWLGPLGFIPLPTRWSITFCEPLRTDMYDPAEADDPLTVLGLSELVRTTIQETIDRRLEERSSIF